jgi:hypothetical protein
MLSVKVDTTTLDRKFKMLLEMPRTIEKAVVGAVAETVRDVHAAQLAELEMSMDKQSPFLKRGLWKIQPYGKGKSIAEAGTRFSNIGARGTPAAIIAPNIKGGPRGNKASAKALAAKGILPGGFFTIEGKDYPRDSKGNITRSRYTEMLAAVGAISKDDRAKLPKGQQRDRKGISFFVIKRGGRPIAIAERKGKEDMKIMLVFIDGTKYPAKYDYYGAGEKQFAYSMPRHLDRILLRYMDRF